MNVQQSKLPLTQIQIIELLGIANGNCDATVVERQEARKDLLSEFQWQWEQLDLKQIMQIDPLLVQGMKDWGFRIFAEPDPVLALEIFLGVRQRPGKRAKNADRNSQITVDVIEKMSAGITLATACVDVAPKYGLEPESIEKIYKRYRVAVKSHQIEAKAEAQMRTLEAKWAGKAK